MVTVTRPWPRAGWGRSVSAAANEKSSPDRSPSWRPPPPPSSFPPHAAVVMSATNVGAARLQVFFANM